MRDARAARKAERAARKAERAAKREEHQQKKQEKETKKEQKAKRCVAETETEALRKRPRFFDMNQQKAQELERMLLTLDQLRQSMQGHFEPGEHAHLELPRVSQLAGTQCDTQCDTQQHLQRLQRLQLLHQGTAEMYFSDDVQELLRTITSKRNEFINFTQDAEAQLGELLKPASNVPAGEHVESADELVKWASSVPAGQHVESAPSQAEAVMEEISVFLQHVEKGMLSIQQLQQTLASCKVPELQYL